MSVDISNFKLRSFIRATVGTELNKDEAKKLGIDDKLFDEANVVDVDESLLDIDEIMDNDELYELFATKCTDEQEVDKTADKEREKEKQNQVGAATGKKA